MGLVHNKIRTSATDVEQVLGTFAILLCPQEIETEDVGRGKKELASAPSINLQEGLDSDRPFNPVTTDLRQYKLRPLRT